MSKQPSPWMRRVGSAALFATLGATIIGFGVAGAVDGGSTSTSTPSAPSSESRPDKAGHHRGGQLNLTDEQKTCLTEAGITKPEGRPTQAERDAFKAAAKTCGITLPTRQGHAGRLNLTDEQKTCLTEAGITKPEGRPTQAERDAFKAAAKTCGITLPTRQGHAGRLNLTDEQKTCLTEAGITKPEGRPTQAERDAFKAAAETCGITLPARPSAEPGLGAPDEAPGMGGRFGDGHGRGGRFGRGFDGPGPSGSTGSTGTDGAPVEPTSGS